MDKNYSIHKNVLEQWNNQKHRILSIVTDFKTVATPILPKNAKHGFDMLFVF